MAVSHETSARWPMSARDDAVYNTIDTANTAFVISLVLKTETSGFKQGH